MTPFVAKGGMLENAWGQVPEAKALQERVTPCPSKSRASHGVKVEQEVQWKESKKQTGNLTSLPSTPSSQHTHTHQQSSPWLLDMRGQGPCMARDLMSRRPT